MARRERSPWTLRLLRGEGEESHAFRFRWRAAVGVGALAVGGLLAAGAVAGYVAAGLEESRRVEALREEVARLQAERERVASLAEELDSLEASYERIRRALGGRRGDDGARAVRLPELPTGDVARSPGEAGGAGPGSGRWPLGRPGFVTRGFGDELGRGGTAHRGVDIAVPRGSYLRAAGTGRVLRAGSDSVFGNFAEIRHDDGYRILYAHADWIAVAVGDSVEQGEVIGLSGNTGRSSAPHLHVEVRRGDEAVDPMNYFTSRS